MSAPVDPWASAPSNDEAQQQYAPPPPPAPAAPQYAPPAAPEPQYAPPPASAPAPSYAPPAPAEAPPVLTVSAEGKFVLTFKGGAGFEAPWLVAHLGSLEEAHDLLRNPAKAAKLREVLESAQGVAVAFQNLAPGAATSGQAQAPAQRQPAPPAAQAPPANAPACPGPGWQYKTGTTKTGRNAGQTWQAWMPPRGSSESPVFFN